MIETLKQAKDGIIEIQELTGWTKSMVANKTGLSRFAVNNLLSGKTKNTLNESTMSKIDKELQRVREVHGDGSEV